MSTWTRRWAMAAGLLAGALVSAQALATASPATAAPPAASTTASTIAASTTNAAASTSSGTTTTGTVRTLQSRGSSSSFPAARTYSSAGTINLAENGKLTRFAAISNSPRPAVVESNGSRLLASATATYPPAITGTTVHSTRPGLKNTWQGLDEADNARAAGFSLEPPDQGMCVGNGKVLEVINDVAQVFTTTGSPATPAVSLASLYHYPEFYDAATKKYGPFLTDPSCIFDPGTQRFYVMVLTLDVDPDTGNLTLGNHLDIAVSKTSNPAGGYRYYSIPTTETGGANGPLHKSCPCLGDYPRIGTDANGFYVTTNEYPFTGGPGEFGNGFNGAQVYAISKRKLAAGATHIPLVQFENTSLTDRNGAAIGFTVLPAQASGGSFATANGGTMYFLSSTAAEESRFPKAFTGRSDRIGFWQLTRSNTLDSSYPTPYLGRSFIDSETYGIPPISKQKIGPTPLRDCLQSMCFGFGDPYDNQSENGLDSSDTRFLTAWYAGGKVMGALDTAATVSGNVQSAAAWFTVTPGAGTAGTIASQGYFGVSGNNVTYPAIATNPAGTGVMGMSLVGADHYPSAAYAGWRTPSGPTSIYMANEGKAPEDGFCEYNYFNCAGTETPTARPRWGDYAAAAWDGSSLYIANEDIASSCSYATFSKDPTCGGKRTLYGNFSTQITRLGVGGY